MDGIVVHSPGDAIAYPNHVRSIGAVIAPRRYRNMSKGPRTRTIASECISIMPDGTRSIFTSKRAATKNVAGIVRRTSKASHAATYEAMVNQLGAVGNID